MDKYQVKINPRAIRELNSIYEYIANKKSDIENGKKQLGRIKKSYFEVSNFSIFSSGTYGRQICER